MNPIALWKQAWLTISGSLWFVPVVSVALSMALAVVLVAIDANIGHDWTSSQPILFGIGADGARGMLVAIAGSMMTVASLTFSLTITTLATVSSQYSSRILRNFIEDRYNQFVLGYFVGLFAYCLVVLRTIRSGDDPDDLFLPSLAVMGGLLAALLSIGVLIFFIHHMAESIQASAILYRSSNQTLRSIGRLLKDDDDEDANEGPPMPIAQSPIVEKWHPIEAGQSGHVQTIDDDDLQELAQKHDLLLRVDADVGHFVTPRGAICSVAGAQRPVAEVCKDIRRAFVVGRLRTIEQDPSFGIRQIVDIALLALSPGVNDTTTAVMCIEHLGVIAELISEKHLPAAIMCAGGHPRVLRPHRSFKAIVGRMFDQIRLCSDSNVHVLQALLNAVGAAARRTNDEQKLLALREQTELIARTADRTLKEAYDRRQVGEILEQLWPFVAPREPLPVRL